MAGVNITRITSLPPHFTALYRLFLRATSAAVLHNGPALRGLRRLYRPSFEAAASAIRRLESLETNSSEAENVRKWMATFDERINNTLSFFHTSAESRGLSHQVVSRLSFLGRSHYAWMHGRIKTKERVWHPQLDPKSPEYSTRPPSSYSSNARKNATKRVKDEEFNGCTWGALGEVVQMAQGRDGLIMGKVRFKRQEIRKKKFY